MKEERCVRKNGKHEWDETCNEVRSLTHLFGVKQGACQGDSGGPGLVAGPNRFSDVQIGVVSFGGTECAGEDKPTVFARISGWVDSMVQTICGDTAVPDGFVCTGTVPQPPATGTCPEGEESFVLDLVTDRYAEETSWELKNAETNALIQESSSLSEETTYEERICLQQGCYTFSITDDFGDGICCEFGSGLYSIRLDGNVLAWGGAYGTGEDTTFGVPDNSFCGDIPVTSPGTPPPTPVPTPSPTRRSGGGGGFGCFSGDTTVTVLDASQQRTQLLPMRNLHIGDNVLTAGGSFEPIYSFGHAHSELETAFLRIFMKGTSTPLEMTREHMVFVVDAQGQERAVPSSMVKIGDTVQTLPQKEAATVTRIDTVHRKGAYAPFTPSGTIVVNQAIVASTFVAFSDTEVLKVDGFSTGLTHQWLSHSFEAPHRWFCHSFLDSICKHEAYDEATGIATWAKLPFQATQFLFDNGNDIPTLAKVLLLFPFVASWSIFWAMEQTATWVIAAGAVMALHWYKARANHKIQPKKL